MNTLFDTCLYFKLNKVLRTISQMADTAFTPYGISSSHAYLMILVAKEPRIGTVELSQSLNLKPSTITRLTDKMVKKGYLKRNKIGKRCEITCTDEGTKLANNLYNTWLDFQNTMQNTIGKETADMLNQSLNKIENKIL